MYYPKEEVYDIDILYKYITTVYIFDMVYRIFSEI